MLLAAAQTQNLPTPSRAVLAALRKWGHIFLVPTSWLATVSYIESGHNPNKVNMSPAAARKGGAWGLLQQMADEADYKTDLIKRFYSKPNKTSDAFWAASPRNRAAVRAALAQWKGRPSDLRNLDLNVMLGAWQVSRLIRVFGEDFSVVMAAYHQGENAVKARMAAGEMPVDPKAQPAGYEYVAKALATRPQYATL